MQPDQIPSPLPGDAGCIDGQFRLAMQAGRSARPARASTCLPSPGQAIACINSSRQPARLPMPAPIPPTL